MRLTIEERAQMGGEIRPKQKETSQQRIERLYEERVARTRATPAPPCPACRLAGDLCECDPLDFQLQCSPMTPPPHADTADRGRAS